MASLETIGPLMNGMKMRADMAGLACEALNRMFQREQTDLVAQVPSLSYGYISNGTRFPV
jgi:DnaJ family protein C protein 13